mmetsp:Transcript_3150/g.5535  ORF Transcript_3150/g.5535 Transcript_3150/m.5535 type:complete len:263 (+) Transcript_3150:51-839(+)
MNSASRIAELGSESEELLLEFFRDQRERNVSMNDSETPVALVECRNDESDNRIIPDDNEIKSWERDVSKQAIWIVSSSKAGNGIPALFDGKPETFWQSDGTQPHTITAFFYPRASLSRLQIYVDSSADESYTPHTLAVKCGTGLHDLVEVGPLISLEENPQGWCDLPLCHASIEDPLNLDGNSRVKTKKVHVLQIVIVSNHQSGRDSHLRGVRALGVVPNERFMQPTNDESQFDSVTHHAFHAPTKPTSNTKLKSRIPAGIR